MISRFSIRWSPTRRITAHHIKGTLVCLNQDLADFLNAQVRSNLKSCPDCLLSVVAYRKAFHMRPRHPARRVRNRQLPLKGAGDILEAAAALEHRWGTSETVLR